MNKYKIISKLFSLSIVISILAVQAVGVIAYISGIGNRNIGIYIDI